MNATLINGGRVHWLPDKSTRCGVGKNRANGQWQMDLGDLTCQRCVKLKLHDAKKAETLTADGRG